ncbi:hypothetical protein PC123_g8456 [Phytophthora cactorum]|nr:hypothetical protein PC123_g8456 [Phytophthora cactorum]
MLTPRPSSPLSTPTSSATLWTAWLVATLWKLAVNRARMLSRQSQSVASKSDIMYGSTIDVSSSTPREELDETSIMHEAALSVLASGIVSLADLEAVTGYRLSKNHDGEMPSIKDDDASSEAATDMSDCCSIAGSDVSESMLDEELAVSSPVRKLRRAATSSSKSAKWVCVGYGRYVKVQA